jgi:lipoate-protein ligase A
VEGLGVGTLSRLWRLIVSGASDGVWNMALDEALAESVRAGGLPFLRFYEWNPYALSLGRFQNPSGLADTAALVPRVRRPTGGGGIWHGDELTYSLGCRQDDLPVTGVKASFELLSGFLLDAWNSLGWPARFAKDAVTGFELGAVTAACFAGQEEYDVTVRGKKLGGNAQRRDRLTIFQHGSIPRRLDWDMLDRLFRPEDRPHRDSVTDLEECGWNGTSAQLVPRLRAAFETRLGVQAVETAPSEGEILRARTLAQDRFGQADWTETGGGSVRPA